MRDGSDATPAPGLRLGVSPALVSGGWRSGLRLCSLALSALLSAFSFMPLAHVADFYVATDGGDSNPGTIDRPFATLDRARTAIRALSHPLSSGVNVWIRGGWYYLQRPFALSGSQDSGTATAPVIYWAYTNETPYIIGGTNVKTFTAVTNAAVLTRLTAAAKTNVLVADLTAQGVTSLGTVVSHGYGHTLYDQNESPWQAELLFQDKAMQLARYPNTGWLAIPTSPAPTGTSFGYTGNEPSKWVAAADIVVQGYWNNDYADSWELVSSIDTANKVINIVQPGPYAAYQTGERYSLASHREQKPSVILRFSEGTQPTRAEVL
jgi:hypothetical protein